MPCAFVMMGFFMYAPKMHILEDQWSPFLRAEVSLAECRAEVALCSTAKTTKSEYPTLRKNKTQSAQEQLDLQD